MRTRGDAAAVEDDDVRALSPGMTPWWRSVGFWLGVPGLVFLVWMWVDSFTSSPAVLARLRIEGKGFYAGAEGPEVYVQRGMVFYQRSRVLEASPGIRVTRDKQRFEYRKGGYPPMKPGEDRLYGYESLVRTLEVPPGQLKAKAVMCWFPVWFVVAGYVVVWMSLLVMWRWWMRRRGKVEEG